MERHYLPYTYGVVGQSTYDLKVTGYHGCFGPSTMTIRATINGDHVVVHLRFPAPAETDTRNVKLALLLDTSGSMEGERLNAVKATLHAARDAFAAGDEVTLITFSETATVLLDHHVMTGAGITTFYEKVDALRVDGCTNMGAAFEALASLDRRDYDAILLLTDGIVNRGVESLSGLRLMATGLGTQVFNTLGYGADHNRALLRDLAVHSRGSYTFIDSESVLPMAIGDILSGIRTEVHKCAIMTISEGWECMEIGGDGPTYKVGNIVADRSYSVVFKHRTGDDGSSPVVVKMTAGGFYAEVTAQGGAGPGFTEQIYRCRVATALAAAADSLERGIVAREALLALQTEMQAEDEEFRGRPLMMRLMGQVADLLEQIPVVPEGAAPPLPAYLTATLSAQMSSGAAVLGLQRGITRAVGGDPVSLFSSPTQRQVSGATATRYASSQAPAVSSDPTDALSVAMASLV